MRNLDGKATLITGATGGLGNLVTTAFLNAGASVLGVSRGVREADFKSPLFNAYPASIGSAADAENAVAQAVERFGRLDILVHLVGGFQGGKSVAETDDQTFDRMVELNLRSAFLMMRSAAPAMRRAGGGRIIAIGSKSAAGPAPMAAVYGASKAALVSLTQSIAAELRNERITANVILPGTMDTPANRTAMPDADPSRWVNPASVARMCVFLASNEAADISGAAIPIFGPEG